MTPEQLYEIAFVVSAARSHATDAEYAKEIDPLVTKLIDAVQTRTNERDAAVAQVDALTSLLTRAAFAIRDGFIGGEWASLVFRQESLSLAVEKEANHAEDVLRDIAKMRGEEYGDVYHWSDNYHRADIKRTTATPVSGDDLFTMLHCSIGYAIGRRTYITGIVTEMVRQCWPALTDDQRRILTRNLEADVRAAGPSRRLGDKCDERGWRDLLAFMQGAGVES